MEQIAVAPPPLPPKTRRSPPEASTTVLTSSGGTGMLECRFPEVQGEQSQSHVVKIRINPQEGEVTKRENGSVICDVAPCIRISVNSDTDMIQNNTMVETATERSNHYFYYAPFNCSVMSSGQVSPSDTLDSGTCSDLDGTPPPLPKKKNPSVSVTVIGGQHKRVSSLTSSSAEGDSDDNESSISCDSLNGRDVQHDANIGQKTSIISHETDSERNQINCGFLPQGLLRDIRDRRNVKSTPNENETDKDTNTKNLIRSCLVNESTYEERKEIEKLEKSPLNNLIYETDRFYSFHLNENENDEIVEPVKVIEDGTFAGYKDLLGGDGSSTIRSAKGTVRGVKNRVRAGIATFLQINSSIKSYKEKDAGKVVVYTTTMGILRETYHACMKVKQILRTLLIKFEERDVFMSSEYQAEIRDRMRCDHILVPQVFVDGQHVGDAETIERLNETGELRKILKPYKSMDACTPCKVCGGYRLLPCPVCNGSKKSVHRNHFTTEFVALKCMNCDEVGLVRCSTC